MAIYSPVLAQTQATVKVDRPPIVTTGPWAFANRYERLEPLYPLRQPPEAVAPTPTGWAAFATSDGRSLDFARPWRWPADRSARAGGMEVGFGWREANWAAAVGYVQPDYARRAGYPASAGPKALVGLSFTVRTP